mmetsp:Transcript_39761/g.105315  ORF Transcript_39761/g.105315 Transcript_39761/m.105315 type:complete len:252 (+) Transcript_39761:399-1154(+)
MAECVLWLGRNDGEGIQERSVGSRVRLCNNAVVLVGVQGERGEQKIEGLTLEELVEAAQVYAENVLRVRGHACKPGGRMRVSHEESLILVKQLAQDATIAMLRYFHGRCGNVLVRPPLQNHGKLGHEIVAEWAAFLFGKRLQERLQLHWWDHEVCKSLFLFYILRRLLGNICDLLSDHLLARLSAAFAKTLSLSRCQAARPILPFALTSGIWGCTLGTRGSSRLLFLRASHFVLRSSSRRLLVLSSLAVFS